MIVPAIPQFLQPDEAAPLGAKQTQFVVTRADEGPIAARIAIGAYEAGDPPAIVWVPDAEGVLEETPAGQLVS